MAWLNLLNICRSGTQALGPGLRYVIWVQGCPFSCPGCITPEGQEVNEVLMTETELVAEDILSRTLITGLTVSGGEPFLQAASLTDLVNRVKGAKPEFNVIVFTGYKIEQLTWPEAKSFLSVIDVLVDGPYVDELNDGKGLRGSSNQRIIFLTDRLKAHREDMETGARKHDVDIHQDETLFIGIPEKKIK